MAQVQAILAFDMVDHSAKAWMVRMNAYSYHHCDMSYRHLPLCLDLRRGS
jgi:hypothetical protein